MAAGLAWPVPAAELVPAQGGKAIFVCLETGPIAVVGEIGSVRDLDVHGRAAELVVERALAGEVERQTRLTIAWVEQALARPMRFEDGDRVLVCLEPLPPQSVWLSRLPNPELRNRTLHVAAKGEAFLRRPSLGGLSLIEHYLALSSSNRSGPAGVDYLLQILEGAEPGMAAAALERLAAISGLDDKLDARSAARLVKALLRNDAPAALETGIVNLIGDKHLERTRPDLEALAAKERPPPAAVIALGELDGQLEGDRAVLLLEYSDKEVRLAAARYAAGAEAERRLRVLSRSDPAPEVRAAAITRLVALQGDAAVDTALGTLDDPELSVRAAAARGLASLGPSVVPVLRHVVDTGDGAAAQAAVGALRWTESPEAHAELVEIAESHPDPAVRTLAALAIGKSIGHQD
jgi:HEAT repeat protein